MLINLRNALMAGKRTPTAKDYVQNGLVAMWDGIENAGWGVHDPNATMWVDLMGHTPLSFDYPSAVTVQPDAMRLDYSNPTGNVRVMRGRVGFAGTAVTAEVCVSVDSGFTYNQNIFLGPYASNSRNTFCIIALNKNRGLMVTDGPMYGQNESASLPHDTISWTGSTAYKNAIQLVAYGSNYTGYTNNGYVCIGAADGFNPLRFSVYNLRLYSRALTASEIAANYAIDKARFGLP